MPQALPPAPPGAGDIGDAHWEMARAAQAGALAAWQSLHPTTSVYEEDINRDRVVEVVITTPEDMYVLSPIGGKLLYWFDLENGEEIVGSEVGVLPGERFETESQAVEGVRVRALLDLLGEGEHLPLDETYETNIGRDSVTFTYRSGGRTIRKTITPVDRGLSVRYSIRERGRVVFTVKNGFSPDYATLALGGRDAVAYYDPAGAIASSLRSGDRFGLVNVLSGTLVSVVLSAESSETISPSKVSSQVAFLGRDIGLEYRFDIASGHAAEFGFNMVRGKVRPDAPPVLALEAEDGEFAALVPSYTRSVVTRQSLGRFTTGTAMVAEGEDQMRAPLPEGSFDLVATSFTGRRTVIDDVSRYLDGHGRHEFFPKVGDSEVDLRVGYARVGRPWTLIIIGIALVLASASLGTVWLLRKLRRE
ncbi:MAG: hypothetical protein NUW23_03970 [Firmicutes bacterium]|nr:hypothetical protein [Bacillota bacterium]